MRQSRGLQPSVLRLVQSGHAVRSNIRARKLRESRSSRSCGSAHPGCRIGTTPTAAGAPAPLLALPLRERFRLSSTSSHRLSRRENVGDNRICHEQHEQRHRHDCENTEAVPRDQRCEPNDRSRPDGQGQPWVCRYDDAAIFSTRRAGVWPRHRRRRMETTCMYCCRTGDSHQSERTRHPNQYACARSWWFFPHLVDQSNRNRLGVRLLSRICQRRCRSVLGSHNSN